ncbi:MAG TPA: AsmA family protein [Dongiaceae bacterium]|nr:AsmA family protein [Dongiaceae bacterium]
MRLKPVLSALVIFLVGLVLVVYAVVRSIDFNAYKDLVAQQVKVALGRDLVIAGDVSVEFGFVPHLTARQITLHNADWSDQPQMVAIDRLDAQVELLPLLFEQVRIRQVTLSGGAVILERNDKGVGNWSFGGTAANSGGGTTPLPDVGRIKLENVQLRYRDPTHSLDRTLKLDSFSAEAAASNGAISWSLVGSVGDNAINLKGTVGSLAQMTTGPFPIDLRGQIGDVAVQSRASIASLATLHGLDVELQVSGSDLAKINPLIGANLDPTSPFKIGAHLTDQDNGYHLDHVGIVFGNSSITGDVMVVLAGDQPAIKAQLAADRIDLADFGFAPASAKSAAPAGDSRLFSATPWHFDTLRSVDADVTLTIGELLRGQSILKNGQAGLKLDHGVLTVSSLTATIDQGQIDASGSLQARSDQPDLALTVKGANIASGPLLTAVGLSDVLTAGALNLDLSVKGPAASEHALMAGLDGELHFNTGTGSLRNSFAQFLLADLTKLISFGGTADATRINCLAGHFDIAKGVARTNSLVMDTPGAAILGQGAINLGAETLQMRIDSKSKQVSLAALAVPMFISGSLQHPTVSPDAVGAIANTGDFVVDAANTVTFGTLGSLTGLGTGGTATNACATASAASAKAASPGAKIKEGAGAIGSGAKQVIQGVGEGAGDAVKGVGKDINSGLKSLFGN